MSNFWHLALKSDTNGIEKYFWANLDKKQTEKLDSVNSRVLI